MARLTLRTALALLLAAGCRPERSERAGEAATPEAFSTARSAGPSAATSTAPKALATTATGAATDIGTAAETGTAAVSAGTSAVSAGTSSTASAALAPDAPSWAPLSASSTVAPARPLLRNVRQLVFAGRRSGEGYFSPDGESLVFQSERTPDNPFYQIYRMDLGDGSVERVSPGIGKTTCAWFHPEGDRVLFASTHEDPKARAKMKEELDFRASGKERRYAWDYDERYELYAAPIDAGSGEAELTRLTRALGYDAEGSYSPDGEYILFASNRRAYQEDAQGRSVMTEEEARLFETNPSALIDLYRMRADGTEVERLTDHLGYDGGPFYSADGTRITWRRFSPDGKTAEIWVMNADGSDPRPLTAFGAMSWAPFFHPSGDYLVFTTNLHGYANFELYIVDAEGRRAARVSTFDGFDGLPVFTPDGRQLSFTSARAPGSGAQVFLAEWDDAAARAALGLSGGEPAPERPAPPIAPEALRTDVQRLASPLMEGRLTGTEGERRAANYIELRFANLGLEPAGDDGAWRESFEFVAGVSLAEGNRLRLSGTTTSTAEDGLTVDEAWRPLGFSATGTVATASVAFAGYGVVAPEEGDQPGYDAYGELDVEGRWVMVLRYLPEDLSPERRQHLGRFGSLRYKAMEARDRGAAGLIVVSGPRSQVKRQLAPLRFDAAVSGAGIAAVSVTDAVAEQILGPGRDLEALQAELDEGTATSAFLVEGAALSARIALTKERAEGVNVLARLPATETASTSTAARALVLGAHYDHLGRGQGGDSLARADEQGRIHFGADDNASGVAGLLAIAEQLAERPRRVRDVVFAAWSGEELGLYGSTHFVKARPTPPAAAYLNLDMIGRLEDAVILQGVASSPAWRPALERAGRVSHVPIRPSNETYLPTDATPFYLAKTPILSAFTGAHGEYHTPRDTPDTLDYEGAARVASALGEIARLVTAGELDPTYVEVTRREGSRQARVGRVYLGTIPDYAGSSGGEVKGVPLSGATKGSPAEAAGIQPGDVLIELAGQPLDNIYDFVKVLNVLKIGEEVGAKVRRGGEEVSLRIVPGSRD